MNDERIEVIYKKGELERFRMEILAAHNAALFLPASFIESDGMIGACYDTSGYQKFTDMEGLSTSSVIQIIRSILDESRAAERRMFFTGEYSLDPEYLYVRPKTLDAALIYHKVAQRTKGEILMSLKKIMETGLSATGRSDSQICTKALELLDDARVGYSLISRRLGALAAETYRAGI